MELLGGFVDSQVMEDEEDDEDENISNEGNDENVHFVFPCVNLSH